MPITRRRDIELADLGQKRVLAVAVATVGSAVASLTIHAIVHLDIQRRSAKPRCPSTTKTTELGSLVDGDLMEIAEPARCMILSSFSERYVQGAINRFQKILDDGSLAGFYLCLKGHSWR